MEKTYEKTHSLICFKRENVLFSTISTNFCRLYGTLHGANVLFSTIGFDSSPKRMTNKMLMLDMPLGQTTVPGWPLSGPQHVAGREEGSVKRGSIIELMISCIFARCESWVLVLNYPTIMGLS
jgi:hypothetical protein